MGHEYVYEFLGFPRSAPPEEIIPVLTEPLPGMHFWLDAQDAGTITLSGSDVTAWADKSGNAINFTSSLTNPVYNATGINGFPSVQNPDTATARQMLSATFAAYTGTLMTSYFVGAATTITGTVLRRGLVLKSGGTVDSTGTGLGVVHGVINVAAGDMGGFRASSQRSRVAQVGSTPYVNVSMFNGTNHIYWLNNTQGTPVAIANSFNFNQYKLFIQGQNDVTPPLSTSFAGHIGEIVNYHGVAHTTTQRKSMVNFLAAKWGISL